MPNIPYPNVPALPGVPALSRSNNAQFVAAGLTIIGEILPLGLFGQKWGIIAAGSSSMFGRLIRLITFPIKYVLFGKASI